MVLLSLIFVGGSSSFTPWHAVLYSGFALNFLALLGLNSWAHTHGKVDQSLRR